MPMKEVQIPIAEIYVPTKRRDEIKPDVVEALAESILEEGLRVPIGVRRGNNRYVLVSGLQRLEACRSLGEKTITAIIIAAPQR
jgi:sulfiredoxin